MSRGPSLNPSLSASPVLAFPASLVDCNSIWRLIYLHNRYWVPSMCQALARSWGITNPTVGLFCFIRWKGEVERILPHTHVPKRTGEGPKPHPQDSTLGESSREGRDLGVAFQAPAGSQASSRGEAKDSEMATYSSMLAWRIPGTGKPGGWHQPRGSSRISS